MAWESLLGKRGTGLVLDSNMRTPADGFWHYGKLPKDPGHYKTKLLGGEGAVPLVKINKFDGEKWEFYNDEVVAYWKIS